jgi:cytoskeletal protein RodZ
MNKKIGLISIIVIVLLLVIGGVAYMMMQNDDTDEATNTNKDAETTLYNKSANKNSNKNTNSNTAANENANTDVEEEEEDTETKNANTNSNANSNSNTTSNKNANTATTTEGAAYKNERYGFSVDVPSAMEFLSDKEELGYYPFGLTDSKDEEGYEGEWFISVYSSKTQDELIKEFTENAAEAEVKKETITVNGLSATKIEIPRGGGISTAVYIQKNGRTFAITSEGDLDTTFEDFYKSFKF